MDPTRPCCPTLACAARGQTGQGNIGIHSRKEQRFICTACHKPFTATQGTAWYRRRTATEPVSLGVTLRAHGGPLQALVVALGDDERPGACWLACAGGHGQPVPEHLVEPPRDLGPGQADASRVKPPERIVWMALALLVRTRWWRAGEGKEQGAMALLHRLVERGRRWAAHRALLCCSDGLCADVRALRETWRDPPWTGAPGRPRLRPGRPLCLAQVVKRYAQRRVLELERRIVDGTPARVETRRRRAPGAGVLTTASMERRNATCRARLAALTRCGRAVVRRPVPLQHGMSGIGTVYNFCTPPPRLASPGGAITPAMATGIPDPCWTVQALLSLHVPPPRWTPPNQRGRRSHTLQRLIARWSAA
jgi:hypothetical protein